MNWSDVKEMAEEDVSILGIRSAATFMSLQDPKYNRGNELYMKCIYNGMLLSHKKE